MNDSIQRTRRVARTITIELTLCKACSICSEICPRQVLGKDSRGYPVVERLGDCSVCLSCEWHCPDFAIEVAQEKAVAASPSGQPLADNMKEA